MTLWIDVTYGPLAPVVDALLQISRCDAHLDVTANWQVSQFQVHYSQTSPTQSATRLKGLVSHQRPCTIYSCPTDFTNPINHRLIYGDCGGQWEGFLGDMSSAAFVDVQDANGRHYRTKDVLNNWIYQPLPVLLYHELAHAYHFMVGDLDLKNEAAREVQAIADENVFRGELRLRLRHPTKHGGHQEDLYGPSLDEGYFPACKDTHNPWDTCKICNIATATLGSPVAREIVEFRRAKRELERLTLGSAPILEPMWNSYQHFSPAVAADIVLDPELRFAALDYGVRPAVCLLQIVRTYLDTATGDPRLATETDRTLAAYAAQVRPRATSRELAAAADAALAASQALDSGYNSRHGFTTLDTAGDMFACVSAAVRSRGAAPDAPAWVMHGLSLFLRSAADQVDSRSTAATQLGAAIGTWLAQIPLPPTADPTPERFGAELNVLRDRLFRHPSDRAVFARRLLARWPDSRVTIATVLDDSGCIGPMASIGN